MSERDTPPDHRAPGAFAGLTQRRKERGLPTGAIDRVAADNDPANGTVGERLTRIVERDRKEDGK